MNAFRRIICRYWLLTLAMFLVLMTGRETVRQEGWLSLGLWVGGTIVGVWVASRLIGLWADWKVRRGI